jgi:hypothetical protein
MKRVGLIVLGSLAALAAVYVAAPSAPFEGAYHTRFDAPRPVTFDAPESVAAFAAVSEFRSAMAPWQSGR